MLGIPNACSPAVLWLPLVGCGLSLLLVGPAMVLVACSACAGDGASTCTPAALAGCQLLMTCCGSGRLPLTTCSLPAGCWDLGSAAACRSPLAAATAAAACVCSGCDRPVPGLRACELGCGADEFWLLLTGCCGCSRPGAVLTLLGAEAAAAAAEPLPLPPCLSCLAAEPCLTAGAAEAQCSLLACCLRWPAVWSGTCAAADCLAVALLELLLLASGSAGCSGDAACSLSALG